MPIHSSRRDFLIASGLTALAGCLEDRNEIEESSASGVPVAEFDIPLEYELDELFDQVFLGFGDHDPADPSTDVSNRDVAIDQPSFAEPNQANLSDTDVVFGIEHNNDARAYPQKILVWNEIVNDVVGGEPISITYCPLTGSVVGINRGGGSFGVSNQLVNSNLILYDRETETWWPQILGGGIANELRGAALQETNVVWTSWARWHTEHPDTTVLTEDTGYVRDYEQDPYGSYDPDPGGYYATADPAREVMHEDDRLHPKEVVVGARGADGAVAFIKETLREIKHETKTVGGVPHSAFYDDALDSVYVYRNPSENSFRYRDGEYLDENDDRFRAGGIPLTQKTAFDVMWFAWFAFFPNTETASTTFTHFEWPAF